MNDIRVKHIPEFKGEDVVLLAFDSAGLDTFLAALTEAQQRGSSRLHRPRRVHDFVIEAGAAVNLPPCGPAAPRSKRRATLTYGAGSRRLTHCKP
jgi:hypothetical protein